MSGIAGDLVATYDSERFKTLSVWSEFADGDMLFRPAGVARTPLEHMVHQCVSEDLWMRNMLEIPSELPPLPAEETRAAFLEHYAAASEGRSKELHARPAAWWDAPTTFFDVERSRAWVVIRRLAHSAHHRGQLTVYLRLLGKPLYSTYGPTADTGGLFLNRAPTLYRYRSIDALLAGEAAGGDWPALPGPGTASPTERPNR